MGNCVRVGSNLSIEARAREHDVGAHHKPEGVIAHDRDLDKHAEDRQDHHNKRSNKPEVHCPDLPGYGETTKTLPACSDIATRELVAKLKATAQSDTRRGMLS